MRIEMLTHCDAFFIKKRRSTAALQNGSILLVPLEIRLRFGVRQGSAALEWAALVGKCSLPFGVLRSR